MNIRIILYETTTHVFRIGAEEAPIKVHNDRCIIATILERATGHELITMVIAHILPGQHTIQRNIHLSKFLIEALTQIHLIQFLEVEEELIIIQRRRKRLRRSKAHERKNFARRIRIHFIRVYREGV
jgi:hypothetical protein